MRKNFFPLRVTEPWTRLPRGAVESPSLEIFKTRLDKVLRSLLWVTLLRQGGWTGWPTEVPSNPEHSVILWRELGKARCSCARYFWWVLHRDEPWESTTVPLQDLPWAWMLWEVECLWAEPGWGSWRWRCQASPSWEVCARREDRPSAELQPSLWILCFSFQKRLWACRSSAELRWGKPPGSEHWRRLPGSIFLRD